jgi:hypothetical protein
MDKKAGAHSRDPALVYRTQARSLDALYLIRIAE